MCDLIWLFVRVLEIRTQGLLLTQHGYLLTERNLFTGALNKSMVYSYQTNAKSRKNSVQNDRKLPGILLKNRLILI